MSDEQQHPEIEYVVVEKQQRRRPMRRVGCVLLVVVWFIVLMLPTVLFVLAVEGDITIARGDDIPDSHEHPLLQASLVMEADFRGLRITNTSLHNETDENLCIQTNVRFVLWQGEGDPATFCDCYTRDDPESAWLLDSTEMSPCN